MVPLSWVRYLRMKSVTPGSPQVHMFRSNLLVYAPLQNHNCKRINIHGHVCEKRITNNKQRDDIVLTQSSTLTLFSLVVLDTLP